MKYWFENYKYIDNDGNKKEKIKYTFDVGKIEYPNGVDTRIFPYVNIENQENYGIFFNSEISNLSLDYVIEIVGELESLLKGDSDFYDGFGFEIYMIECDKENAKVVNFFEDKVEAIIPTMEVYELIRDWRDFLIKFEENRK